VFGFNALVENGDYLSVTYLSLIINSVHKIHSILLVAVATVLRGMNLKAKLCSLPF
jgi:hypothetical protein